MITDRSAVLLMLCALVAGKAVPAGAQPFVGSVAITGPVITPDEEPEDLAALSDGSVALAGRHARFTTGFFRDGWLALLDADGAPLGSWSFDGALGDGDALLAVRQAGDGSLVVLGSTDDDLGVISDRLFYARFDQSTGLLAYAWRYLSENEFVALGMELDGPDAVVAALTVDASFARRATLLRFGQSDGVPVFLWAYALPQGEYRDPVFTDLDIDPVSGDIYAAGRVSFDDGVSSSEHVLLARLDAAGAVVWCNAYPSLLEFEQFRSSRTAGVEITSGGDIAVIANSFGEFNQGVETLLVDAAGVPLVDRFYTAGDFLSPADASAETVADGSLLVAGTRSFGDGQGSAVMFNLDPGSLLLNWYYEPGDGTSFGSDAIEHPGRGLLLTGRIGFASVPAVTGFSDALLVRTDAQGMEPCSVPFLTPDVQDLFPRAVPLALVREGLPAPTPAALAVTTLDTVDQILCTPPCLADTNGDGMLTPADFSAWIAAFNAQAPECDQNGDGECTPADFSAWIANFNAGCP